MLFDLIERRYRLCLFAFVNCVLYLFSLFSIVMVIQAEGRVWYSGWGYWLVLGASLLAITYCLFLCVYYKKDSKYLPWWISMLCICALSVLTIAYNINSRNAFDAADILGTRGGFVQFSLYTILLCVPIVCFIYMTTSIVKRWGKPRCTNAEETKE